MPIDEIYVQAVAFGANLLADVLPEMKDLYGGPGHEHQSIYIEDMLLNRVIEAGFVYAHEVQRCFLRAAPSARAWSKPANQSKESEMADNLSNLAEQNLCDYFLKTANSTNQTAITSSSIWAGLCTAAPTDAATNECTAGSYARAQVTFTTASTNGAATGPTTTVSFPSATTSWGDHQRLRALRRLDRLHAASGYLAYGTVSPTVAVTTNDTVSFAANAMTLTFG